MIPILYKADEKEFKTNGLGRLSDAADCIVTEERNGMYELEMSYPVSGIHYGDLDVDRIILAVPSDGAQAQPFQIYSISRPIDGMVTVMAQHISYMLKKLTVLPFNDTSAAGALTKIGANISGSHPFTFWTDKTSSGYMVLDVPTDARSALGGTEGSVLDVFGGEYEWDRFAVKLWANRGSDKGVTIRYGKNLTGLEAETDCGGVYTAIIPYWQGRGETGDEDITVIGDRVESDHAGDYAYQKCIPMDFSSDFETAPSKAQLKEKAAAYLKDNNTWSPQISVDMSFQPLWQTEEYAQMAQIERVSLCDTVTVVHPGLGVSVKAKVIKTVYDVLLDRYREVELGDARSGLLETLAKGSDLDKKLEKQASWLEQAILRATDRITGGLGGHVVIKCNANGQPEEILILDTDSIETAQHVWRWNAGGFGYSSTGYAGPYGTAITMDGEIVADFIVAGELNANIIKSGRITSKSGKVYFDLDNNEIHCDMLVATESDINFVARIMTIKNAYGRSDRGIVFYYYDSRFGSGGLGNTFIVVKPSQTDSALDEISSGYNGLTVYSCANYGGGSCKDGLWFTPKGYTGLGTTDKIQSTDVDVTEIEKHEMDRGMLVIEPKYIGSGGVYKSAGAIHLRGNVYCNRTIEAVSLQVSGIKNRIVPTDDYDKRLQYCYETPSPMFGDVGQGKTDESGECIVFLDDVFYETVSGNMEYQVFLQKEGPGDLWISEKTPRYFIVRGSENLKFAWELKAHQRGYEFERLEQYGGMTAGEIADEVPYDALYAEEIEKLIAEQEECLYETA